MRKSCHRAISLVFGITIIVSFMLLQFRCGTAVISSYGHELLDTVVFSEPQVNTNRPLILTEPHYSNIRSWGCHRHESPFIFVHIGKSGGGDVRARIAASALNVTKAQWKAKDDSFYPIRYNATSHQRGVLCNSRYVNTRPFLVKTYESTVYCHAETPLTGAVACHVAFPQDQRPLCCMESADTCPAVYLGHNCLGSEMHWMPIKYLRKWWSSTEWSKTWRFDPFEWPVWCQETYRNTPTSYEQYLERYDECSLPHQSKLDSIIRRGLQVTSHEEDWSPLYASLPVLRVTMMRDPFSWLISKFFWTKYYRIPNLTCDDVEMATHSEFNRTAAGIGKRAEDGVGWARVFSTHYILHVCGEDCMVRYLTGSATLDQIEKQAAGNLKQSFAVVGLLNETDNFYKMINARVGYMNTSLNQHLKGGSHSTNHLLAARECQELYADPNFQQSMLEAAPEIAALWRLYQLAVKVNRFQMEELRTCPNSEL